MNASENMPFNKIRTYASDLSCAYITIKNYAIMHTFSAFFSISGNRQENRRG